jgi:TonB family protein
MKIIHSLFALIAAVLFVLSGCKSTTIPKAVPTTEIYTPVPKHDPVIKGDYITADKADTKPQPILPLTPPVYPGKLRRAKVSGSALIAFIIMPDGSTAQVQAIEATHRGFADAAVECVEEWNYKPALKDGKRVSCLMMVPIAFYPPSPQG